MFKKNALLLFSFFFILTCVGCINPRKSIPASSILINNTPSKTAKNDISSNLHETRPQQLTVDKPDNLPEGEHREVPTNKPEKPRFNQTGPKSVNEEKIVYLTFDDGPNPTYTPLVLNILNKNNIKATFFLIGKEIKKYPALAKEEYNEGNKVANHTYTHEPNVIYSNTKNPAPIINEINETDAQLKNAVGNNYVNRLFRFPGGLKYPVLMRAVQNEGYHAEFWTCYTKDSETVNPSKEYCLRYFNNTFHRRSREVVLMHDSSQGTVDSLQDIINILKASGYKFGVLS